MRKTQCKCDFTASRLQLVPAEGLQSSVKSCCVSQHSAPCTAMHFWHEPTLTWSPWARSYFAGVILPVVCLKLVLWFHPQKYCSYVSADLLWAEVPHGRKLGRIRSKDRKLCGHTECELWSVCVLHWGCIEYCIIVGKLWKTEDWEVPALAVVGSNFSL